MRRVLIAVTVAATAFGAIAPATTPVAADDEVPAVKVAIIVGPVGPELTPVYIGLAEMAATAAEDRGATVARAYSPDATVDRVLEAVQDANVVIYFGHGIGFPNPYTDVLHPATVNGWALDRDDPSDSRPLYLGESWIAEHAHPAPGWVMIYSNACYAPGAGEGFDEPASEETAAARVSAYSRAPLAELGASAYFATDFYGGAATLVASILDEPDASYADIFAADPRYRADAVVKLPHASVDGAQTWLQRSAYFEGTVDYWYAFAGDPEANFGQEVPFIEGGSSVPPLSAEHGFVTGLASSYSESAGWEGQVTVALPVALGGGIPDGAPATVIVCADRCVRLPVVDSCPCYVGTSRQRVANLSIEAWHAVSDAPLIEGLIPVEVYLNPPTWPSGWPPSS